MGWRYGCTGSSDKCTVEVAGNTRVTAQFKPLSEVLAKEVRGKAHGWSGSVATVHAETSNFGELLGDAPLGADGSFELTLPGGVAGDLSVASGTFCDEFVSMPGVSGSVEVEPGPLELTEVYNLGVYAAAGGEKAYVGALAREGAANGASFVVSHVYVPVAATVRGNCTYTGEGENGRVASYTETYDLALTAGWNDVVYEFGEGGTVTVSTGKLPAVRWEYYVP